MTDFEDHIPTRSRTAIFLHVASGLIVVLLLGGCGGSGATNPSSTPVDTPAVSSDPSDIPEATATALEPAQAVETIESLPPPVAAAINLARQEFNVERGAVTLLSYSEQSWPSTALGCPEPGQLYAQVITSGYLVKLSVAGQEVIYHTNLGNEVVRCVFS